MNNKMKALFIVLCILLTIIISFAVAQTVKAAPFSLFITCVDTSQPDRTIYHVGYESDSFIDGTSYLGPVSNFGATVFPPNGLSEGRHDNVGTIEVYYDPVFWQFVSLVGYDSLELPRNAVGTNCADMGDVWHPGAVAIPVAMTTDCANVDTKDYFKGVWTGNWSRVRVDGKDVLLHYGEVLFGGQNQSANPEDYRAVPTPCY